HGLELRIILSEDIWHWQSLSRNCLPVASASTPCWIVRRQTRHRRSLHFRKQLCFHLLFLADRARRLSSAASQSSSFHLHRLHLGWCILKGKPQFSRWEKLCPKRES